MVKTEDCSSSSAHCPNRTCMGDGGDGDGDMSTSYDANNMYVVRSSKNRGYHAPPRSYGREREICKAEKSIMWHSKRELKRRRRIVKYNLYSMEGKMKDSFNNGYRWLKRECFRIFHGF
ncbi:PREDICTED: uncharacterized protein LOC109181282 [Ipomoea nil]|uniref:uncharacterized protein LOC109181282 n=1 Tax=Ipomoea nil TaxID=35883 RepID=UPI000901C50F|nr:PREDICTED: uncharacterized protein LOC109181282 [Ipomoea nil]